MKQITCTPKDFHVAFPEEILQDPKGMLFFDIETTGFSAKTATLYLIGVSYYSEEGWRIMQWFAQSKEEEAQIISAFFDFAASFSVLVHFNGSTFDIPFLKEKCRLLEINEFLDDFESIDLYRLISPYRHILHLPDCRQKSLEHFLGIHREDAYSGGDLIEVYESYLKEPSTEKEDLLLLHNFEDAKGMLLLLPILSYLTIFRGTLLAKQAKVNTYVNEYQETHKELLLTCALEKALPVAFSLQKNGCYLRADGDLLTIKVPIYQEEMKYFYGNFKDYYYLPYEDVALHKSVAGFVDKNYRIQATAATCYTRKASEFLPQWKPLFSPFFQRNHEEKDLFFELTDDCKKDKSLFDAYVNHVVQMMLKK